jgi:ABC-type transport system involved in Fe-S cluster assembly fused permease/ATPase subunit
MTLIMLGLIPFLAISAALGAKIQTGLVEEQNKKDKDANLLCGDAIINYKTVQSFGYEDKIVELYRHHLQPGFILSKKAQIKGGFFFGFSQFT